MEPKNFYVVEFRKAGKQPFVRSMDVVYRNWVLPGVGNDAHCHYPDNSQDKKVAKDLNRRLSTMQEADPTWPVWKIIYIQYMFFFVFRYNRRCFGEAEAV